jgi:integrase/recombinase XerD
MGTRAASRKAKKLPGNPNDPEGLTAWMVRYLEAMRVKNYSPRTVGNREMYLGAFIAWCDARSITRPQEVTKPIVDRYQRHLFHYRRANGKPLSFSSQIQALTPVRSYFKWLTRSNVLLWNPASEIELPRAEKRLPKHVLTIEEADRVLEGPNVNDPLGLRDRAILETLYSTGIRRMEVIHLMLYDLDAERGTVTVRQGKGKKDRMVPIGERAVSWVRRYVDEARPQLVLPPDHGVLFLTQDGEEISRERLTQRMGDYVKAADIGKTGSCHLFRHTCATLMLEGGADIRYIQEMLGHVELTTTQIYTRVSIRRLKAVHSLTHPSAKNERPALAKANDEPTAIERLGADDEERAALEARRTSEEAERLMNALAAEATEEGG